MKEIMCRREILIAVAFLITLGSVHAQFLPASLNENDPCGYPDTSSAQYKSDAALNWGYSYDSLRVDLARWAQSPFVRVDSVGATVQNRAMYMMTIQDTSTVSYLRKRVWIHARTHPNEVQGTWVTNEMIRYLLSARPEAKKLRDSCVFNVMPMYNPDGVELAKPRENANNIDIESNWSAATPQPEVQVLKRVFIQFMSQPNPIRVALNMHSAYACRRYFVYHTAAGTSSLFATTQQIFIGNARAAFPGGIEPYTYFTSWPSTPPPTQYPESWFWYNHREAVLANTYEDKNCVSAGGFDSTASAILTAVGTHLGVFTTTSVANNGILPEHLQLDQNYPNPFNPMTNIKFEIPNANHVTMRVFDILGREVATLVDENLSSGSYEVNFSGVNLASGMYLYRLESGSSWITKRMTLVK